MTITVLDSLRLMSAILDAPQADRADLVRAMWQPLAPMYRFVPGGLDLAEAHRHNFGFRPNGDTARVRDALRLLAEAEALPRIERALHEGASAIAAADPGATVPDLTVLLIVGDPTNDHFVHELQGLSAFGGISGSIAITVWPSPTVLDRLEAIALHELHHNIRYSPGGVVWDPRTVTLGEQVVAEGLADLFATASYGQRGLTHFVDDATWTDDAVLAKVNADLDITGMHRFTAWIHGDASARLFGAEPVGLPTGAGYAAGVRLVRAYLDTVGDSAAQHVRTPAYEIIEVARDRLGLTR